MANYHKYTLTNRILTGPNANRPAAGIPGRLYIPTDGYIQTYKDNGTSWDTYVGNFKCNNPPAITTFSGMNIDSATTLVQEGDGLLLQQRGKSAPTQWVSAYVQPLPAPPYQLAIGLNIPYIYPVAYNWVGLTLTDGAKLANWNLVYRSTGFAGFDLQNAYYNSPTSWNADNTVWGPVGQPMLYQFFFMRLRDDGTTRYYEISGDNRTWITIITKGRTDFLTPTYGGLLIGQATPMNLPLTTISAQMKVLHWYLGT